MEFRLTLYTYDLLNLEHYTLLQWIFRALLRRELEKNEHN